MARDLVPCKKYAGHGSGKRECLQAGEFPVAPRRRQGPGQRVDFPKFIAPGLLSLGNYSPVSSVAY